MAKGKGWVSAIGDELDREKYKISPQYIFNCYQCDKCETSPVVIDPASRTCPFYDIPEDIVRILDLAYTCKTGQKPKKLGTNPSIKCTNGNRRGGTELHCGECANRGKEVIVSKRMDTKSLEHRNMTVSQVLYHCKTLPSDTLVTKNYSCENFKPAKKGT